MSHDNPISKRIIGEFVVESSDYGAYAIFYHGILIKYFVNSDFALVEDYCQTLTMLIRETAVYGRSVYNYLENHYPELVTSFGAELITCNSIKLVNEINAISNL